MAKQATLMPLAPAKIVTGFSKRNSLVYGVSGVGKTHLIGTAQADERLAPVLNLDFDGGGSTLEGSGVKTETMQDWQDFNDQYELLTSDSKENIYKTVSLDSTTMLHSFTMFDVADTTRISEKDQKLENRNPAVYQIMKNKFEQDEYGIALNMMQRIIVAFRNLPINTIFTALADTKVLPRVGSTRVPMVYGKLAEQLPGYFDGVFYYSSSVNEKTDKTERVLILQNYPGITCKIRTTWGKIAPDELIDPTFTSIYNAYGL
jgi:hypothetical protein